MKRWNLKTLPWDQFHPELVDAKLLKLVKGASLVEYNSADYVEYLFNVFPDDQALRDDFRLWGVEERLHGEALREWCRLADPSWDFDKAFKRFTEAYRIPVQVSESVRGSCSQELIARCVVESGTTSFYTAMRDASREPLLREICSRIAADEVRHYHLFLSHLDRDFAVREGVGVLGRTKTILERALEANDEELSFAYFAANEGDEFDPSKRDEYSRRYMAQIIKVYQPKHFQKGLHMVGKASGLGLRPWMTQALGKAVHSTLSWRYR